MRKLLIASIMLVLGVSYAEAKQHRHHYRHSSHHHYKHYVHHSGGRPHAWCGWWLKHALGVVSSLNLNMAREWVHWGRSAPGPAPGVVGVEPHHVFKVIAVVGPGRVLAISGNDGHAVKTRIRSTSGVIAWRQE